jgi:hypothetical protein
MTRIDEPNPDESWRCAVCGWEGVPPLKQFSGGGTASVCGRCHAEDVFPVNDGGGDNPVLRHKTAIHDD